MRNDRYRLFTLVSIVLWTLAALAGIGFASVIANTTFDIRSPVWASSGMLLQLVVWSLPVVAFYFTLLAIRDTASPRPIRIRLAEEPGPYGTPVGTRKSRKFFSLEVITKALSIVLWFAIGIFTMMLVLSTYAWTLERLKPTSVFIEMVRPHKQFVNSLGMDFEPLFLFCVAAISMSSIAKWLWHSASKDKAEMCEPEFSKHGPIFIGKTNKHIATRATKAG